MSPSPNGSAAADIPAASPSQGDAGQRQPAAPPEPVLCGHCGRTASNGISCQGFCVADSGY
ncbi:MAG: hypothetical protein ACKO5F_05230 [Synechococcus sp.]